MRKKHQRVAHNAVAVNEQEVLKQQVSNDPEGEAVDTCDFNLPPLDWQACGQPVVGTLIVGCISANGLYDNDGWLMGKSDPFCRARLTDALNTEKRGSYQKFVAVSQTLQTRTIKDDLNPSWNETFEFDVTCPQHPDLQGDRKFQLEVTIKDKDWLSSTQLGNVYIPFDDILHRQVKGTSTFPLLQNLADSNDVRSVAGSVTLSIEWCPKGHDQCINKARAAAGSGLRQEAAVDCNMACYRDLQSELASHVDRTIRSLKVAGALYGFHDAALEAEASLSGSAGGGNGSTASNVSEDDANVAIQDAKGYQNYHSESHKQWLHVRSLLVNMHQTLGDITQKACGDIMIEDVAGLWNASWAVGSRYDHLDAGSWLYTLFTLKSDLKAITTCLESKWHDGQMLPITSKLTSDCAAYYSAQR